MEENGNMSIEQGNGNIYGDLFKPCRDVKVIKKDGSLEAFDVQKVIDAVGKSAYRALTKFTDDEKRHIANMLWIRLMS